MIFNFIATISNTIILLILFFYQKNKNKVLLDRIDQQKNIIEETKGLLSAQSIVMDSQSKVVASAVSYSQVVSPERIEKLIRREIELEYKAKQKSSEQEIVTHTNAFHVGIKKKKSIMSTRSKHGISTAKSKGGEIAIVSKSTGDRIGTTGHNKVYTKDGMETIMMEFVSPFLTNLIMIIYSLPLNDRTAAINAIDNEIVKKSVVKVIKKLDTLQKNKLNSNKDHTQD